MTQTATASYPVTSGFAFPSNEAAVSGPGSSRYGLAVADQGRTLPPPVFPEDAIRLRTLTGPTPPSHRSKERDLPPLPARVPTVSPNAGALGARPAATRNFSRPNVQPLQSFAANSRGHRARSFSFDSESGASSARPPSLTFSNERESDGHADSPITPHRPGGFDDATQTSGGPAFLHAPPSAAAFPHGKENKPAAGAGVVSRLRHAASASNIGRGLTKKGKLPSSSANGSSGFDADESFLPAWRGGDSDAASTSTSFRQTSQTYTVHSSHSQQPSQQYLQSPERPGLLRGRKSSFQGLRAASGGAPTSHQDGADPLKKGKGGFWGSLWNKQDREKEDPISAPPTETEFPDIPRASNVGGPRPSMQELGRGSKADRLLGFDEAERQRLTVNLAREDYEQAVKVSKLAKAHDMLAEFLPSPSKRQLELHEAMDPPMTRSRSSSTRTRGDAASPRQGPNRHNHNVSIASSKDSLATASTDSRVPEVPPTLETTVKFAERKLSDDIEAVLRSQRDSMQGADKILTLHHAINAKSSSHSSERAASHRRGPSPGSAAAASAPTTPASGTVALPPTDRMEPVRSQHNSRHSPHNSGSFLALRPGHATSSSTSSSECSTSDRNRSSSIHSQGGRSLRWADEEPTSSRDDTGPSSLQSSTLGDLPPRRAPNARSHGMERLFSEPIHRQGRIDPDQFEDADEDGRDQAKQPAHPFAFRNARPPLRSAKTAGEGETLSVKRNATLAPMQRAHSNTGVPSAPLSPSSAVQRRAAETLSSLPPLSTLLDACVLAAKSASKDPWQDLTSKPLGAKASREQVPPLWADFVRAYARGDIDITSPPKPQSLLPPSALQARTETLSPKTGDPSPALQSEASFDLAFPLPPSRLNNQGMAINNGGVLKALEASRLCTNAYDSPVLSSCDEDTMPDAFIRAKGTATAGVLGDMKAPRPPYEAERQQVTLQYLSALGLDGPNISEKAHYFLNAKLLTIVERLAILVHAAEVSIQFICDDEVITLARAGHLSGSYEDEMLRTPRAGESNLGALGLDPFHDAQKGKIGAVRLRENSLDAHAILSRHGAPVSFLDLSRDWRFSARCERGAAFYAAKTILSVDGLPLGTVSLRDSDTRLEGLSRQEMLHLVTASAEISEELERIRRVGLSNRLAMLDETLAAWCTEDHSSRSPGASSEIAPKSIESTLLSAPAAPGLGGAFNGKAPPSPGTLAQRRGLKVPRSLAVPGAQHPQMPSLQAALRIIASALRMDLAYIAQVGSHNTAGSETRGSGTASCSTVARYDTTSESSAVELHLDGQLHLCALAATKRGLHLQQDPARVSQLLGTGTGSADMSRSLNRDQNEHATFHTAVVVNCGFKEAGKSWKGSQGWVLAVASRLPSMRLSPECTIYLLRFAGLIAPMLLDGPRSPGLRSPRSASRLAAYDDDDSPKSPGSGSLRSQSRPRPRSRSRGPSPGPNRRVLPPTSPPPNEPLPMLPNTPSPLVVARPLPTVNGGEQPPRAPSQQPTLSPKNRLRSAASSPAMRGRGLPSLSAAQENSHPARSPASTTKGKPSVSTDIDADAEDAGTVDYLASHLSMASSASGDGSRRARPGHRQAAASQDSTTDTADIASLNAGTGWHSHSNSHAHAHTPSYSTTSGGHGYSTSFSSAYAASEESNGATNSSAHRSHVRREHHHARTPSSLSGSGEVVSQRQQARQRLLSQAQSNQSHHQQQPSLQSSDDHHYSFATR